MGPRKFLSLNATTKALLHVRYSNSFVCLRNILVLRQQSIEWCVRYGSFHRKVKEKNRFHEKKNFKAKASTKASGECELVFRIGYELVKMEWAKWFSVERFQFNLQWRCTVLLFSLWSTFCSFMHDFSLFILFYVRATINKLRKKNWDECQYIFWLYQVISIFPFRSETFSIWKHWIGIHSN